MKHVKRKTEIWNLVIFPVCLLPPLQISSILQIQERHATFWTLHFGFGEILLFNLIRGGGESVGEREMGMREWKGRQREGRRALGLSTQRFIIKKLQNEITIISMQMVAAGLPQVLPPGWETSCQVPWLSSTSSELDLTSGTSLVRQQNLSHVS